MPKLGHITVQDYNVPEMPSPTMQKIDSAGFEVKKSFHNKNTSKYESKGLRQLCPNLFVKKFKKDPVPRQFNFKEMENTLPSTDDPSFKENLIQRANQRKTNTRDMIFMSHLSRDRTVMGKFKSGNERRAYQLRYYRAVKNKILTDLKAIESEGDISLQKDPEESQMPSCQRA